MIKEIIKESFFTSSSKFATTSSSISLQRNTHVTDIQYFITTRIIKICAVLVLTDSLGLGLFLREHPQDEVGLLRRFEGRRDDQVLARREAEPGAHLSHVDEGL